MLRGLCKHIKAGRQQGWEQAQMDEERSWELTRNIEGMSEEWAAEVGKKKRDHWRGGKITYEIVRG